MSGAQGSHDGERLADVHELRAAPTLEDVARQVLAVLDERVPDMGAVYRRELPEYAAMDEDAFANVLTTTEAFIRKFVSALAEGVAHPLPDHPLLVAAGRRRQLQGISLDAAMHAFRIASREGWAVIADASTASAPTLVSDVAGRWLEYADRASTAFAEGHTSASSEQLRRLDARRLALVADLLAATDDAAARVVASAHGLRLASSYVPVVLTDELDRESRIEAVMPMGTILGRRGGYLLALVPAADMIAGIAMSGLAVDGAVVQGDPAPAGPGLRAEVARCESILSAASNIGRRGLLEADALALHRAVTEHEGLSRHVRRNVLEPLVDADPDGVFRETLTAYLACGAIRAVADTLFVHVNTVTYRLRRVTETTGLDPRVPEQATQLVLALALAAMDGATSEGHT